MVTKNDWRAEAPDLIHTVLRDRLPSECEIIAVKPDSFYQEGEEHRFVTVTFKGADPYDDSMRLIEIEHDIHMMLWERGYDPVPGIDFLREGTSLV